VSSCAVVARRVLVSLACLALGLAAAVSGAGQMRLPAFAGCLNVPQARPAAILVACGDGNFFLTNLKWSRWNNTEAVGAGTGHQNDCKPYCAAGHFHPYPVAVRLFRPEACRKGRIEFTRFTFRFVSTKPPGVARGGTFKSPFFLGTGCP